MVNFEIWKAENINLQPKLISAFCFFAFVRADDDRNFRRYFFCD